jgi:hypothetical protein
MVAGHSPLTATVNRWMIFWTVMLDLGELALGSFCRDFAEIHLETYVAQGT